MKAGRLAEASVWVFVGLAIGILFFRTFSRLLFFYPARVQQKYLRMELLELLEKVPVTRYQGRNQGQIFQVIFDDVNNIRAFIGFGLLQIGNLIIAAFVFIPKINETDSYLWPAFIPLFASVFIFTFTSFLNQKYFKKMMEKKGEVQQYIIESYEAKQTIKNFQREENFVKGFVRTSSEELALFFKSSIALAFSSSYIRLGLGLSLIWAAFLVRQNGGTTPDLVFFSGFLYLFLEPVSFLSWVAVVMSQGFAAWKRVKELHTLLNAPSLQEEEFQRAKVEVGDESVIAEVEFWNSPIELSFPRAKWTALIGETGGGKSYLLSKIATGLILQESSVSMVQQEPYLFNDTIQENIFLGKDVDENSLTIAKDLIRIFQLDNLADDMDQVLKLEVGENGKRLSGGQMKRVALIRSLLSGASVLIWDDPFSSIDIISERKIVKELKKRPEWADSTFIISSHRLTTVRLSDQVIMLDKEEGIKAQGDSVTMLKEENVARFFKEQLVGIPLA